MTWFFCVLNNIFMARADLQVIGFSQNLERRIAASATRFEYGEPLHSTASSSSGAASANTYVLAAADTPVIGTHRFGGIALEQAEPKNSTDTVVAHRVNCACPVPSLGRIEGKAETSGNIDTDAELLAIIGDYTLIDYNATGGADGGELYTIQDTASADTSGLEILKGNTTKGTLQVTVDARAYRHDVT